MRVNTFQRWNRKTVFPPRLARPHVATIINLTRNRTTSHVYTIARKFFPKVDKISSFFLPSFFPLFPTKNPLTIIRTRRREADYAFVAHRWMPNECRVSGATISQDRGRSLYTIENFARSNGIIILAEQRGVHEEGPVDVGPRKRSGSSRNERQRDAEHRMPDGDSLFRLSLVSRGTSSSSSSSSSRAFHARHARSVDHKGKRIGKFHCNFSPRLSTPRTLKKYNNWWLLIK